MVGQLGVAPVRARERGVIAADARSPVAAAPGAALAVATRAAWHERFAPEVVQGLARAVRRAPRGLPPHHAARSSGLVGRRLVVAVVAVAGAPFGRGVLGRRGLRDRSVRVVELLAQLAPLLQQPTLPCEPLQTLLGRRAIGEQDARGHLPTLPWSQGRRARLFTNEATAAATDVSECVVRATIAVFGVIAGARAGVGAREGGVMTAALLACLQPPAALAVAALAGAHPEVTQPIEERFTGPVPPAAAGLAPGDTAAARHDDCGLGLVATPHALPPAAVEGPVRLVRNHRVRGAKRAVAASGSSVGNLSLCGRSVFLGSGKQRLCWRLRRRPCTPLLVRDPVLFGVSVTAKLLKGPLVGRSERRVHTDVDD